MTTEYVARLFREKYNTSCIPVTRDKMPLVKWNRYRDVRPTDAEIRRWFARGNSIAVVAGSVQCIDFDEKYSAGIFEKFKARCVENMVHTVADGLLCQRTPSGGYHLIFICEPDEKNQKLAVTENGTFAIETRASGGYFLISPSSGYEIVGGNIDHIPTITTDERDELFSVACSFNCSHKESNFFDNSAEKPSDDYDAKADIPELLREYGWTHVGGNNWRRPNKDRGISATWNHIPNRFFVLSSSTPFEPNTAYKPWHIFAVLKCGGDFRRAAGELSRMGYGLHSRTISTTSDTYPQVSESFCREKEIGLIIFDPVYKIADDFDENKAKDVAALLREFEKLAASLNAAIAFAHHFAKGNSSEKGSIDRASGSGVWAREPDALLMITPLNDENYTLEMHLRNFPQKPPVAVFWNDGVWEVNPNVDVEEEISERSRYKIPKSRFKAVASDLQRILQDRGEIIVDKNNRMKIAGILGVSERTVYTLRKQLKNSAKGGCSG